MRKKKVALCSVQVPFVLGGAELLVESLNRELLKRDFDSTVVNIPFKWYPKTEIMKHALMWRLLDLSESNGQKIDLVITTKFPSYGVKHENKVTWLIHQFRAVYDLFGTEYSDFGTDPQDIGIKDMIVRFDNRVLNESKRNFTIAKNTTNRLMQFNRINAETLYHPPKHVGKYFNEDYGDYILSIGRLESIKRVDLLIKAMKHVKSDAKCLIGGTGPQNDELMKLVQKYDLEHKIKFLGFVTDEDLINLYANSFAVYYAPFDEDYGYITLEAFLSKKPVLTTLDTGGVLEFVENNKNGFVTELNPEQLASRIDQLYSNKALCRDLGNHGYEKVSPINWDHVIDQLTATIR